MLTAVVAIVVVVAIVEVVVVRWLSSLSLLCDDGCCLRHYSVVTVTIVVIWPLSGRGRGEK